MSTSLEHSIRETPLKGRAHIPSEPVLPGADDEPQTRAVNPQGRERQRGEQEWKHCDEVMSVIKDLLSDIYDQLSASLDNSPQSK